MSAIYLAGISLTDGRLTDDSTITVVDAVRRVTVAERRVPERGHLLSGAPSRLAPHRIAAAITELGFRPVGGRFETARAKKADDRFTLLVERLS
jgi:hypothetical protein